MSTHFKMADVLIDPKLVEKTLREGDQFQVSVAEAITMRQLLRGAIWSAATIRLTTDIAHIMHQGGQMTVPTTVLAQFAASLVFDAPGRPAQQAKVSATIIVLVIAAAAVIGYAISHLDAAPQADLVLHVGRADGQVTFRVAKGQPLSMPVFGQKLTQGKETPTFANRA
jgi:hypothetical protein